MSRRDFSERDIHLAIDGELPAEERPAYLLWLDAHPDMKARAARFEEDGARLRATFAGAAAEPVPARLSGLVGRPLSGAGHRSPLWRAAAAAVLLLVGGIGGYALGQGGWTGGTPTAGVVLARDALEAHVLYAAEKQHVVEVAAEQREHLLGWLSKRVGLTLVAPDLSAHGLTLLGGRLLPAGAGKAAQFMYQDAAGERVSLYVTAEPSGADTGFRLVEDGNAATYYWLDDGYGCAVSGTMAPDRLLAIANGAYSQILSGTPI